MIFDTAADERPVCAQVDFFDASGTLFSMANFINNFIPGAPQSTVVLMCTSAELCLCIAHENISFRAWTETLSALWSLP